MLAPNPFPKAKGAEPASRLRPLAVRKRRGVAYFGESTISIWRPSMRG